ncbi:protein phosphatase 2C family protein [Actinidia rufa]|uniref:protein-serine/threonine phosphatase n=1 Tax=Actinidia rufa TaxID=165716 RepID=A0A7J0HEU8_9ERIC|nr:protein phosphatase 2C family protein [Actinidia rufa]
MVAETETLCQSLCVPKRIDKHSPSESVLFKLFLVILLRQCLFLAFVRVVTQTKDIGNPMKMNISASTIYLHTWAIYLGALLPGAFYGVFDGHGGSNAAAVYVKDNAMKLFFEDANLPQTSDVDDNFLEKLENRHRKAFLLADQALAGECSVPASCGTTALTALVLGGHLIVANAGDCRAVLCRKGVAIQISQDHRPSSSLERQRVEEVGGYIEDGFLNGDLAVTRALGDWYMKFPLGSSSPLISEPEIHQTLLTEDDEFLIVACDGIWDVMSNEDAVRLVRRALRRHNDPHRCAGELVNEALRLNTSDNLTAIVVCFASIYRESTSQRPRLRCCSLSEEARNRLRSLLEGN